ncbi:hypothetical protein SAMN05216316_1069 [Nitrosovibrio sp. Nv6]|nr:hypothetical protein SAMN05216316_1069 [Nitrosovibrio sp. Nv6]
MAIDLGSGNTTRYHKVPDHADFSLPNADWTWLALVYPESTADIKYLISTGAYGAIGSTNIYVYNTAAGLGVGVKVEGLTGVGYTSRDGQAIFTPARQRWEVRLL